MVTSRVDSDEGHWPLIGRDDELAIAAESIASGRGVVLAGTAGVGKTRLARELMSIGETGGARVEWIVATATAARVPLGAVAHLVATDELGGDRDATLKRIAATLHSAGDSGPLVVGVDDAHLLDDASALLIHQLALTGAATVVATIRSGEPVPDAIVSLWKDFGATLIALQSLARDEVDRLAASVLTGGIDGAALQLLWESSGGNALYLRELVRHGLESGALRREHELWRWHGTLRPGERLRELIAARMGALSETDLDALGLVAVGEPLPIECVRALGLDALVDSLEQRGLVASQRRHRLEVRMGHPLFGEEIRARLSPVRVDEHRRRLADAMDEAGRLDAADQFRTALWRTDAGDHSHPDQLRAAARRALALWSSPVAERLARAALESGLEPEAAHLLAEALADQGRSDEALQMWETIDALDCSDHLRATIAVGHASLLHFRGGRAAEAEAVLRRAASRVRDARAQALIDSTLAVYLTTSGAPLPANVSAELTPLTALAAAIDRATHGEFTAAENIVDAVLATVDEWADEFPSIALFLELVKSWARAMRGDIEALEADVEVRHAEAVAERAEFPRVAWCVIRGMLGLLHGSPGVAIAPLTEGIAVSIDNDRGWLRPLQALTSMATALAGDVAAAEDHHRLAVEANRTFDAVFGSDVGRAAAWVQAAGGETSAAVDTLLAVAHDAASSNHSTAEALALHDACRFGAAARVAGRLAQLADETDGCLIAAFAAHARALADLDGAALDKACEAFADVGLHLFAAEASAAASRAHRQTGRIASSYTAHARAVALAARCGPARTPALQLIDPPVELTPREREVADLAAAGLLSKQIASKLGVTTRTVDNLLGRTYAKLDIGGRQDLIDLFGRAPRE